MGKVAGSDPTAGGGHLAPEWHGGHVMPNRPNREHTEPTNNIPSDHHHGGRELPDDVQDRPEQNAGYDAAVKGNDAEPASEPFNDENDDLDLLDLDKLGDEEDVDPDGDLLH
jgi:hypothetical protein